MWRRSCICLEETFTCETLNEPPARNLKLSARVLWLCMSGHYGRRHDFAADSSGSLSADGSSRGKLMIHETSSHSKKKKSKKIKKKKERHREKKHSSKTAAGTNIIIITSVCLSSVLTFHLPSQPMAAQNEACTLRVITDVRRKRRERKEANTRAKTRR